MPPLAAFFFLFAVALVVAPGEASAQPPKAPEYIAIGDSLAFGIGVPQPAQQGYVALAYDSLKKSDRYRERGLDLLNLAIPGATSSDLLLEGGQLDAALAEISRRAQDRTSDADGVEIISVDIGANDLLTLASATSPCITDPSADACLAFLGQTLEKLQSNLHTVLARLRQAAPQAGIYALDLYNPFSGTGDLREGLADLGVQQFNGVVGAVVADTSLDVKMGDVFQLFKGRGKQWIAGDGLHPNEHGHQVLAEVLLATIDNRAPQVPKELLAVTPVPVADSSNPANQPDSGGDGDVPLWVFLAGIPVAFAAGVLITGGYFVARGRG